MSSITGRYTIITPAGTKVSCRPFVLRHDDHYDVTADIVLPDGRVLVATTSSSTEDEMTGYCEWLITSPDGAVSASEIDKICDEQEPESVTESTDTWWLLRALRDVYRTHYEILFNARFAGRFG